jgi:hypothetical protein
MEEEKSTTLLELLDFTFPVNIQWRNGWLDLNAFVGFQSPISTTTSISSPCHGPKRPKTTFQSDVISNS